jgi:hypothetical protein
MSRVWGTFSPSRDLDGMTSELSFNFRGNSNRAAGSFGAMERNELGHGGKDGHETRR